MARLRLWKEACNNLLGLLQYHQYSRMATTETAKLSRETLFCVTVMFTSLPSARNAANALVTSLVTGTKLSSRLRVNSVGVFIHMNNGTMQGTKMAITLNILPIRVLRSICGPFGRMSTQATTVGPRNFALRAVGTSVRAASRH